MLTTMPPKKKIPTTPIKHAINPYAENFHFLISDNLADFFFPDRQEGQSHEEYALAKGESKNVAMAQWKTWAKQTHDTWDNGIWYSDEKGKKQRSDPYGPPWYFPSTRLAMMTDLFRPSDLDVFDTRAKLIGARSHEYLAKLEPTSYAVVKDAEKVYDSKTVSGITRERWIEHQVEEWRDTMLQRTATVEMSQAFIQAIEAIRTIRKDNPSKYFDGQVTPEEIDVFAKMTTVAVTDAEWMSVMKGLSEAKVKQYLCEIFGDPEQKDSGVEQADHLTTSITVRGERIHTAFLLKGPGSGFRPMKKSHHGKNGDQVYRMASTECQLLVLQHCHTITEEVRWLLRLAATDPSNPRRYCIIDGKDTFRILRAHSKV